MDIYLAKKDEAVQIARIHQEEINQGFLSQLGIKFLAKLYEAMIVSSFAFVVVAKENNRIVGFISGCYDVGKFYRDFYRKYAVSSFFTLLPKVFKISFLKKVFEILKYPKNKQKDLPKAELLTIALLKDFRARGIAQELFKRFLSEMRDREIDIFKVVVGESLPRAIGFYEKVGFKLHSFVSIHKGEKSRIYTYNLS